MASGFKRRFTDTTAARADFRFVYCPYACSQSSCYDCGWSAPSALLHFSSRPMDLSDA